MNQPFLKKLYEQHRDSHNCPSPEKIADFFKELLGTLFPDFSDDRFDQYKAFESHVEWLKASLFDIICTEDSNESLDAKGITNEFFSKLEPIHDALDGDIAAMEAGDPAARSKKEVVRTYPGFYAIAAHRIAHELHVLEVAVIPRMLSEHAHSHTGIDIHPGAQIGSDFCIDHGTGIVIGETSIIGNHVKIYQGVTLGALSVNKADAEKKRHPTIEDHVVLYSGATILGGETVIGHHSVVGGNVWITKSILPNSKVYYQAKMNDGKDEDMDHFIFKTEL